MMTLVKKLIRLVVGLVIMSAGMAMSFQSNLGLSPWDVLHDGISRVLPLTVGQISIGLGLIILVVDVLFKEKIGFGTIINILVIGGMFDLIMYLNIFPSYRAFAGYEHIIPRIILLIGSMLFLTLGMYGYMSAELGAGPRDTMMCMLTKKTKRPVGVVRLCIEGIVFVIGFFLGGKIGIGSIILVVCSGPLTGIVFKLFKFDVTKIENETMPQTIARFKKATSNRSA